MVVMKNGETENRTIYIADGSCDSIISCASKSSAISSCTETSAGECVCEETCVGKSTISSTCREIPSAGCICAEKWVMKMFLSGDVDEDNKLSKEETWAFYDGKPCVDSYTVGVTKGAENMPVTFSGGKCVDASSDDDTTDPWCSIKVTSDGDHLKGFWKYCERAGFNAAWMKAMKFDLDNDAMLSLQEVIAFEDATFGSGASSSINLQPQQEESEVLTHLRAQLNDADVVDLSKDFQTNSRFNKSAGAVKVQKAFNHFNEKSGNEMLSVMVIENGLKVAEFYGKDENGQDITADSLIYVFSATKTVMALLIGQMLKDYADKISYESTLEEIFPNKFSETCTGRGFWGTAQCFGQVEEKKPITLLSLLTMTSGLHDCVDNILINGLDTSTMGGVGVHDTLNQVYFKQTFLLAFCDSWYGVCQDGAEYCSAENWHYVLANNILSYILKQITTKAPNEYIKEKIIPGLGIEESEYKWCTNSEGVGHSLHGLMLTTTGMAKIGQLYLQRGRTNYGQTESEIVTKDFMNDLHFNKLVKKYVRTNPDKNVHDYLDTDCNAENYECGNEWYEAPFYSFFTHIDVHRGTYCAVGVAGKIICWMPEKSRVIVIARTLVDLREDCDFSLVTRVLSELEDLEAMELLHYISGEIDGPYDFMN